MAIKNSEQKYQHLVENSLQGIVIIQDFKIVFSNPAFAKITGYSVDELIALEPKELINLVHPDDQEMIWGNLRKRMAGAKLPPNYKFEGLTKDGKQKILELYASVIDYNGKPAMQGLILDVTDQIDAEKKLMQRTQLIETIVNNLSIGIAVKEIDTGKNIFINSELRNIFGLNEDEIPNLEKILRDTNQSKFNSKNESVNIKAAAVSTKLENLVWDNIEISTSSGDKKFISAKMIPLPEQKVIVFTVNNITERLKTERYLQNAVIEKETLLKEIHHRVKNNLQTVSSLLDLQAESITEPESLEAFRSSQSRIKSMALIHERLYKSKNLSEIKASEYIKNLVEYLEGTYHSPSREIEITTEIKDHYLSLDVAISCGLIINELVSNSMKYAFPQNHYGNIKVSLQPDKENNLILTIKDNGIGMPLNFKTLNPQSLGLELVKLMVKQLNGKTAIDGTAGTTITITFPEPSMIEEIGNH
ncbi:MAG: PAS domain S-box protein [Ignavibacteriaceae bacterium]|nr:PAS domain S-box protein [Ignavibacteriaceae bacterium]